MAPSNNLYMQLALVVLVFWLRPRELETIPSFLHSSIMHVAWQRRRPLSLSPISDVSCQHDDKISLHGTVAPTDTVSSVLAM
jgi:hypothetical protein